MAWTRAMIAAFWCLSVVASSPSPNELLQTTNASSLLTLRDSADPALVWFQYERFLLSKSRTTSFVLYFMPASTCYSENDEVKGRVNDQWKEERRHEKLVEAAVELAAETLSPQLPIVRIDSPKFLDYHLVSSTPSLLWIPERASGHFQRYPHIETNFLDLSTDGSLFPKKIEDVNDAENKNPNISFQNNNQEAKEAVAREIAAFVRSCQERSGYLVRNSLERLLPAVPVSPDDDAFSGLEIIPIVAALAFVAFVVNENRELVHGAVRTRSFWFVLCSGVIFIALSGLFHSIIHRRAWYYFGRMHGFVFVYPSSRRQFVLEGLVHGTWSFWFSLAGMSISEVLPTLRSQVAREDLIRWSLLLVTMSYVALHFAFLIKYRWLAYQAGLAPSVANASSSGRVLGGLD